MSTLSPEAVLLATFNLLKDWYLSDLSKSYLDLTSNLKPVYTPIEMAERSITIHRLISFFELVSKGALDGVYSRDIILDRLKGEFDNILRMAEQLRLEDRLPNVLDILNNKSKEVLPILLFPADPDEFKSKFIEVGSASIMIFYSNGKVFIEKWLKEKFSESSNVIGNLRSRPKFRLGEWQALGISRIEVSIP